jgi:hypothetical protein
LCGAEDAVTNNGKQKLNINDLRNPSIVSKTAVGVIVRSPKEVFTNDKNPVDQAGKKSGTHRNGFCVASKERKCLQVIERSSRNHMNIKIVNITTTSIKIDH